MSSRLEKILDESDASQSDFHKFAKEAEDALHALGFADAGLAFTDDFGKSADCQIWGGSYVRSFPGSYRISAQVRLQDDGGDSYPVTELVTYQELGRTARFCNSVVGIYPDELKQLPEFITLLEARRALPVPIAGKT